MEDLQVRKIINKFINLIFYGQTREVSFNETAALFKTALPEFQSSALLSQNSRDIFSLLMGTELALAVVPKQ